MSVPRFRFNLVLFSAAVLAASSIGWADPTHSLDPQRQRQALRLVGNFRRMSTDPAGRVQQVLQLQTLGPQAVAQLKQRIDGQIDEVRGQLDAPAEETPLAAHLAELRDTMKQLRDDPDLTKDKIKQIGDPTVEQLRTVYEQWVAATAPQRKQRQAIRVQLEQLATFFAHLQVEWDLAGESEPRPLDVPGYRETLVQLVEQTTDPVERKIAEVALINAAVAGSLDAESVEGMNKLNQMRIMLGLPPLAIDPLLCRAAGEHCEDMQEKDFFSHTSPVTDKRTFGDRAKLAGTTASGENIYMGSGESADALKAWFYSPGHHKNMFGKHHRQGLGNRGKHWTLMFGRSVGHVSNVPNADE